MHGFSMDILLTEFSSEDYEFVLVASLLSAVIGFYLFVRNWKRLRIVEDTPTARLRSAHQGYIELKGKGQLIDDQPIYAPLSNHPCLWYHSQIEQQETFIENGRTQIRWNVVYKNISGHRFKLTDGENNCYVDPTDAEVNGNEKLVWYGHTEWPIRTRLLESQSIVHAMISGYRYSEWLILPEQPLYILGQFSSWPPATQQSVRGVMINLINEWKQDQQALQDRFDADRNGKIDQQEWETARQAARAEAQRIHDQRTVEPVVHVIAKPHNAAQPFIISVHPQALLVRKYRRSAFLALTACIASIGTAAWLMHMHG